MTMPTNDTIVWQRLDLPGHELCSVSSGEKGHLLTGSSIFVAEGNKCLLSYRVVCDAAWKTQEVHVVGSINDEPIDVILMVEPGNVWTLNGVEQPQVEECIDVDLAFSPATNLLPIRRCNMAIGDSEQAVAAWLTFPELTLEKLPQRYTRQSESIFHYVSSGGDFETELTVKSSGFVSNYPLLWREEHGE